MQSWDFVASSESKSVVSQSPMIQCLDTACSVIPLDTSYNQTLNKSRKNSYASKAARWL